MKFWDDSKDMVTTRYLGSVCSGKTATNYVFEKFLSCIDDLDENKFLQVMSDGPIVNLRSLDILQKERANKEFKQLTNLGTCGIITFTILFTMAKKAPSRRVNYEKLTLATEEDYPLQFCSHRWIENDIV